MSNKSIEDDLLNLKKYPSVMFMDMYGNGNQCWDRGGKKEDDPFAVVFRAKYVRIDLALDEKAKAVDRSMKLLEEIKHEEFYQVLSNIHTNINNAGHEDRRSKLIELLWGLMDKYSTEDRK
jgi:hypothetical protein